MGNNQQYQSMKDLIQAVQANVEKIESGALNDQELSSLIDNTRELYDRLVILRYKAFESQVKGEELDKQIRVEDVHEPAQVVETPEPLKEEPKDLNVPEEKESSAETSESQEKAEENSDGGADLFGGFRLNFTDEPKEKPKASKPAFKPAPGRQESIPMPDQPLPFNNPNPPKPVDEPKIEDVVEEEVPVEDKNQTNLIDEISTAPVSLNDKLAANQSGDNLAKKLSMQPIADLKTAIGINQKFLFMNDLFKGEHDDFHKAIDNINNMDSINDAQAYISDSLMSKYDWDMDSVSVQNFLGLVERRFL